MDETVRSLLRFVLRGFYDRTCILIMDAVILHSVLSEDDLIYLLGLSRKELRALCHTLVEDRLLSIHNQREENPQLRLMSRLYYYIHITEAIDAVKWKVHLMVLAIKDEMTLYGNPHGYVCGRCRKKVSQLDAILMLSDDKSGFVCDTCGGHLVEDDTLQQASIKQEKLERLMLQVDPIIGYLKKIDNTLVEDNTFEGALTKAIPALSLLTALYSLSHRMPGKSKTQMLQLLQNAASKANATLHVSITASDENYEKEQQEKELRRQKLEQNALPSWHSASTVGDSFANTADVKEEDLPAQGADPVVPLTDAERKEREAQDVLAAYYAELAEKDADDDDDDDDFEDFEDV